MGPRVSGVLSTAHPSVESMRVRSTPTETLFLARNCKNDHYSRDKIYGEETTSPMRSCSERTPQTINGIHRRVWVQFPQGS